MLLRRHTGGTDEYGSTRGRAEAPQRQGFGNVPGRTQTFDLRIMSRLLQPGELPVRGGDCMPRCRAEPQRPGLSAEAPASAP